MKNKQKYNKGDYVHIVKDLGPHMSHFESDCEAIVMHTYDEAFGDGDIDSYCLYIKGHGRVSWYYENQIELIEANRLDMLDQWETEEQQEDEMKSDLDWIFSHGNDVLKNPHGATVGALAKCLGLTNLWGSHGEGMTYYFNTITILQYARPFLRAGDKEGWLNHCKTIKAVRPTINA